MFCCVGSTLLLLFRGTAPMVTLVACHDSKAAVFMGLTYTDIDRYCVACHMHISKCMIMYDQCGCFGRGCCAGAGGGGGHGSGGDDGRRGGCL